MKARIGLIALALLASAPAYAGPCGARPCTAEQINQALQWLGRPGHEQIGHSRVLHDDGAPAAGVTETRSTVTIKTK